MPAQDGVLALEELRQIAYEGISFAENPYDRDRYEKLAKIVVKFYSSLTGLKETVISERFKADLGAVTPKLGVNAIILNESQRLLLCRRADDGRWCMPGGWVGPGESLERAIVREVHEETGLRIRAGRILSAFSRRPSSTSNPHGSVHLVLSGVFLGGKIRLSHEVKDVSFVDPIAHLRWHRDHRRNAQAALRQLSKERPDVT